MTLLRIDDFLKFENDNSIKIKNIEKYKLEKLKKSNFRFAFYLLDKDKRIAISNFHLLCSYLDNIVDGCYGTNYYLNTFTATSEMMNNSDIPDIAITISRLRFWKSAIKEIYDNNVPHILTPLTAVFQKYSIPFELIEKLIGELENDVRCSSKANFEDLLKYCYGVASVVGLVCMYIFTANKVNKNLEQYAINLGYALQLTNIIRDVGEDWQKMHRVYIPSDLLNKFDYAIEDIYRRIYNTHFYELMNYLYSKAIYYYNNADSYIQNEDKTILKSAEAMKNIYRKLLEKIKKNNFHIYEKKIKISNLQKLIILFTTKG